MSEDLAEAFVARQVQFVKIEIPLIVFFYNSSQWNSSILTSYHYYVKRVFTLLDLLTIKC